MTYAHKLDKPAKSIKLSDFDPSSHGGITHDVAQEMSAKLGAELAELQELLYAAATHSVLIVLQGMDTSGKDGTISHVFEAVNPLSCSVAAFKVPTPLETAHDFLWRIHEKVPQKGILTIFNRSHYEDVLVVRVHEIVPEKVWKHRYEQINHFEHLLTSSDTIVMKFFLNISKDEQKERLLAREEDETKGWKLSVGDWQERKFWDDYQNAYADVLEKTATDFAPWYVVPGNHKWFRNLAVAEAIVVELRKYRHIWDARLAEISKQARADLAKMRSEKGGS